MDKYKFVQRILDQAVGDAPFGAHGPFWRGVARDEFVEKVVFGKYLVDIGSGDMSNLVLALRGEAPFGSDVTPRPAGALFRRMPAGRMLVPADRIDFIAHWIDEGCPEGEVAVAAEYADVGAPLAADIHSTYWREFDDWAMFDSTQEVSDAIQTRYFRVAPLWFVGANDPVPIQEWHDGIRAASVKDAIQLLSKLQVETLISNYGHPIPFFSVLDSCERFGSNTLPDDPLRPRDVRHNMNGPEMWFFWAGFGHAAIELGVDPDFWFAHLKLVLIGLICDGVFRGRYIVNGFSSSDGLGAIRDHVLALSPHDLVPELRQRLFDSGFGQ